MGDVPGCNVMDCFLARGEGRLVGVSNKSWNSRNNCIIEGEIEWVVTRHASSSLPTPLSCSPSKNPYCSHFNVRTMLWRETWDLDRVGSPWIWTLVPLILNYKHNFSQFINEPPKVADYWKPRTMLDAPNISRKNKSNYTCLFLL